MKGFRELKAWEKVHALTLSVYRMISSFPANEIYGLTSQIRRAASSIPANIAEGCGREGDREFARYLQIAMGSASELECHMLLVNDPKYFGQSEYHGVHDQITEVKRMLSSFIQKLRAEC